MPKEIIKKEDNIKEEDIEKYLKSEEFNSFLEDCESTFKQLRKNASVVLVQAKWELGKRIVEEELRWGKAGYGQKIIEFIAHYLGISPSHLWQTIQFYRWGVSRNCKTFEEVIDEMPELGDNINWFEITKRVLPHGGDIAQNDQRLKVNQDTCNHQVLVCKNCKKVMSLEEVVNFCKNKNTSINEDNN